ncbi:MAG: hypothetical protein GX250_08755 [Clostridiales bacterium]|jgi:hypothetical protein|nr:hypothetical protein [Clostridiales bacterium]
MIKRLIRPGLVKYEKEESDLRQEAVIEVARIELEEKEAESKRARIAAVLQKVEKDIEAFRRVHRS